MAEQNPKSSLAENMRSIRRDFHDELEDHLACLREEHPDSASKDTCAQDVASRFGDSKQIELFLWFYFLRSLLMSNIGKIALATAAGCLSALVAWTAWDTSIQNRRLVSVLSERLDDLTVQKRADTSGAQALQAGVSFDSLVKAEHVVASALRDLDERLTKLADQASAFKESNPELVYRNDKLHDPYAESYAALSDQILKLQNRKTEIDAVAKHIKESQSSGRSTSSLLLALRLSVDGLEPENIDGDSLELKLKEVVAAIEEESKLIDSQIASFRSKASGELLASRELQSMGFQYEQLLIQRRAIPELMAAYTEKLQDIDLIRRETVQRNDQ
ncbi:MAG TPA: hypothetical protein DDW52_19080 [Planctomycetaceae bacterium]|nr:hypothetical protein [Planctomycetaceae bacterium]